MDPHGDSLRGIDTVGVLVTFLFVAAISYSMCKTREPVKGTGD